MYLLRNKIDAYVKSQQYKYFIEKKTGQHIIKLKADEVGEYSSNDFLSYLENTGIQTKRGPAHQPTANYVSERFNLTLRLKICTHLVQSGLPLSLWRELAQYCSHQINCVPSKAIDNHIPLELFSALTPAHTHPFDHN